MLEQLTKKRNLAKALNAVKRLVSERGESNAISMADDVVNKYRAMTKDQHILFFSSLFERFNPNAENVLKVAQSFAIDPSARNYIQLQKISESPRQEFFRRLNRASHGTAAVIQMRRDLLQLLNKKPELVGVDFDLRHLLSSWFNPGFLKMQQVDWKSPAELLEKLIQHEAVHEVDGWDDLRRRLQPDRRCFTFFHPQLPNEPLIFVEVALLSEIPTTIAPLIDKKSEIVNQPSQFKVAVFYSISNCEPGLRGVSMGNFLIKRVAEKLHAEIPEIKTFVTLSPIPGFIDWITAGANFGERIVEDQIRQSIKVARDSALVILRLDSKSWSEKLAAGWNPNLTSKKEKDALLSLASIYLGLLSTGREGNPVAKFHLGNGAKLHLINWASDLSRKGLRQSAGMMVNYLYDLKNVESNHEKFANGEIVYSKQVRDLMIP